MGEITKLVANRQSNAHVVTAALEVHAKRASTAIGAVLFPKGEPKHLTVELLIDALAKALTTHAETISEADRALADELGDDQAPLRRARRGPRRGARRADGLPEQRERRVRRAWCTPTRSTGPSRPPTTCCSRQAKVAHAALAKGAPKAAVKEAPRRAPSGAWVTEGE